MLYNSISANVKVYALPLKQKSTMGVFNVILPNFRTAIFENNFGWLFLKRQQRRKMQNHLWFQVFTFSRTVIYEVMKQYSFSTNFCIVEPFNLDYVIYFYIPTKGLTSPVFTIKILVAEIFGCCQADN